MPFDIFKNFPDSSAQTLGTVEFNSTIREIVSILADPVLTVQRKNYLYALQKVAGSDPEKKIKYITTPLTNEQLQIIVRKGIKNSINDGDIEYKSLLHLVHSIEGIDAFTDALADVPWKEHHESWSGAFDLPFKYKPVPIKQITGAKEPVAFLTLFKNIFSRPMAPAYAVAAVIIVCLIGFIQFYSPEPPAGKATLIVEFNIAGEYVPAQDTNLLSKFFQVFTPYITYAANLGFDSNSYPYNGYTSDDPVPAGLKVRLVDSTDNTIVEGVTNGQGMAEFNSLPDGNFTVVLEGGAAHYYIPVEINGELVSTTKVINSNPEFSSDPAIHRFLIDAKTIHDSDGDGEPDDDYSYILFNRPFNTNTGGRILRHEGTETQIDTNGDGDFTDDDDTKISEADDDGIPPDPPYTPDEIAAIDFEAEPEKAFRVDGDEDNDGLLDNVDPDIDNDGIPNETDTDIDGDGILNTDDHWPDGITEWDDFEPPTLPDGSEYPGILSVVVNEYLGNFGSVTITYPAAVDDKNGPPRYRVYYSTTPDIDFKTSTCQLNNPHGNFPADGTYTETLTIPTERDMFFAVKTQDYAEPVNMDENTMVLKISVSDWLTPRAPVPYIAIEPQTQEVGQEVLLYADGSFDPDGCSILKHEWDLDGDGIFEREGKKITHTWFIPGEYPVQYRVTDNEGSSSTLETPIIIYIYEENWQSGYTPDPVLTWGGNENDQAVCMVEDNLGNIYVATNFGGLIDFDPGPGRQEMGSRDNCDIALSKFDRDGYFLWVKTWKNNDYIGVNGLANDSSGNIYMTGKFALELDFDPGPGKFRVWANMDTPIPNHDAYLVKLNPEGDFIWALTWGEKGFDVGFDVEVDDFDNVYVTGIFGSTVDFDPGPDEYLATSNNYYGISHDIFISKFNTEGIHQWTQTWGTPTGSYELHRLDTNGRILRSDSDGNIYLGGFFAKSITFNTVSGPVTFNSEEYLSGFLLKLNLSGEVFWARAWGADTFENPTRIHDIHLGNDSLVYVTTQWHGNLNLDLSSGIGPVINSESDSFGVLTFNTDGDLVEHYSWNGNAQFVICTQDRDNNLLLAGSFSGDLELETTSGSFQVSSHGDSSDLIYGRLNPDGIFEWIKSIASPGADNIFGAIPGESGQVVIVGGFSSTIDFDPGSGILERTSNGGTDVFLLFMDQDGTLVN